MSKLQVPSSIPRIKIRPSISVSRVFLNDRYAMLNRRLEPLFIKLGAFGTEDLPPALDELHHDELFDKISELDRARFRPPVTLRWIDADEVPITVIDLVLDTLDASGAFDWFDAIVSGETNLDHGGFERGGVGVDVAGELVSWVEFANECGLNGGGGA